MISAIFAVTLTAIAAPSDASQIGLRAQPALNLSYLSFADAEKVTRKDIRARYDHGANELHEYTVDCRVRVSKRRVDCDVYWKYYNRGSRKLEYCSGVAGVKRLRLRLHGQIIHDVDYRRVSCYQVR